MSTRSSAASSSTRRSSGGGSGSRVPKTAPKVAPKTQVVRSPPTAKVPVPPAATRRSARQSKGAETSAEKPAHLQNLEEESPEEEIIPPGPEAKPEERVTVEKPKRPPITQVIVEKASEMSGSDEGDEQQKDARRFGRPGAAKRKTGNVGASDDIDVTSAPTPAPETVPVPHYNFGVMEDEEEEEEEVVYHQRTVPRPPPPKRPKPTPPPAVSASSGKKEPLRTGQVVNNPAGRITVDAPAPPREAPFVETPLPGIADEVESYPCKFCPERVFLTSFGLERHTKLVHPEKLNEILEDITRIQEEWKRREKEREKQRERLALAKIRQEALAAAAARDALQMSSQGYNVSQLRAPRVPTRPLAPAPVKNSGLSAQGTFYFQGGDVPGLGQSNFESCRICGLLINAEHPTAMENHMRAHKKNDELREHLMSTYGPEFVARVTCHECQLVFTDERKLISHAEAMHVRRRKYVCKWCGHVCLTMTDLNNHKAEVHGMPVSRSRDPDVRRARQLASLTKGRGLPPPLGVQSAATRRAVAMAEAVRTASGQSPRVLTSVEELPCRTTCDFCGLVMVKPSLLIRHMMRVHNRTNFSATVETKGMPSFKITVDNGKLSWTCCRESYTDRSAFVYHRRMNHTPKLHPPLGSRSMHFESASHQQTMTATGEDGQQYVVLVTEGSREEGAKGGVEGPTTPREEEEQQIVLTPEQLQQLGLTQEESDNVLFVIDDGSGNMTTTDGTPIILDESQIQGQQTLMVGGGGDNGDGEEGSVQVMINDDGEVQLVEPANQEDRKNVVTRAPPVSEASESVDNIQQFLNTQAHASERV